MPGQQQSNSERIAGILTRARQQPRPDPFQGIAPRPAWEGAAGLPPRGAPPAPVSDQWAEGLRWGREQEGYNPDSDNAPLDQASLARLRGEVAEDEYSPLGPDWGWIDPLAGLAIAGGKAGVDSLMSPFDEGARERTQNRREYLADAGIGALDFNLGNSGDQDWGAKSDFWADREGAENIGDWILGRPGHERRLDRQQLLGDVDAQSQGIPVLPDITVEGTDVGPLRSVGAAASDLWRGPSEAARASRRDAVTGFAMEDALREAGDEEGAAAYERQARHAAAADVAITGSGALELAPGIGLVDAALGAGRFGARQVLRATGGREAQIPHYLAPRDWSPTEAFAGRADEPLHDPGLLTRQSESWRLPTAVTAVGAVAADQAMDGDFGDLNQLGGGAALTAGALRVAPQVLRGGAELVGRALGRDPLGDIAPRAEAGAARKLEGGARVYEDGYARTTVDPNGRVSHTYQGGYESGGGSAGEAVSSMRSALRALEQDIEETGRPSYSWTPGLADQQDPRLAQFYRDYFESHTPAGYVFSESDDGVMHLNRVVDAEATPAPQRRFEAAVRDPETGQVYTGQDHVEAIDSAPEAARARLQALYDAPTEDPNAIGFVVDGQFMGREEGMAALRERAGRRPVRIGEQVNRDGSVTPASPIDWENGSTRLPADDEWFNTLAGRPTPPRMNIVPEGGVPGRSADDMLRTRDALDEFERRIADLQQVKDLGARIGEYLDRPAPLDALPPPSSAAPTPPRQVSAPVTPDRESAAILARMREEEQALRDAVSGMRARPPRSDMLPPDGIPGATADDMLRDAPDAGSGGAGQNVGFPREPARSGNVLPPSPLDDMLRRMNIDPMRIPYENRRAMEYMLTKYGGDTPDGRMWLERYLVNTWDRHGGGEMATFNLPEGQRPPAPVEGPIIEGELAQSAPDGGSAQAGRVSAYEADVYRGQNAQFGDEMRPFAFFTTDPDYAAWAVKVPSRGRGFAWENGATVHPGRVRLNRPRIVDADEQFPSPDPQYEYRTGQEIFESQDHATFRRWQDEGYDGAVLRPRDGEPDQIVTFDPQQTFTPRFGPTRAQPNAGPRRLGDAVRSDAVPEDLPPLLARNPNTDEALARFRENEDQFRRALGNGEPPGNSAVARRVGNVTADAQPTANAEGTAREPGSMLTDSRLNRDQNYAASRALDGLSPRAIAEEMDTTAAYVRVLLAKARALAPDLEIPRSVPGRALDGLTERARALRAQGLSYEEIGDQLNMSPTAVKSRVNGRRAGDPLDAIAPLAIGGGAAALAFGDDAEAQDAEVLSDGRMIEPLPDVDLSQGQWQGEWSRTHLSDGSEALMRVIEGPDGQPYTIIGVQGRSGQIDFLGTVEPTEGPPGPYDPVGDVYEHAYDNSQMSEPYEPAPRDEEGRRQPAWLRPLLATGAGLATRGLVGRGAGRLTQDFVTGGAAAGADVALGGDWTEGLSTGLLTAAGARGADIVGEDLSRRLRTHGRDAALLANPEFRARRDAFAETLPDDLPTVRVTETENYHGEIQRPDEGLFGGEPFVVPGSEMAEQGYSYNRPVASMPTQREQFEQALPEQQLQWMEEAERGRAPDTGQIGFASGIESAPQSVRAAIEAPGAGVPRNIIPPEARLGATRPLADGNEVTAQLADADEMVQTNWGANLQARAGRDYILTGADGERWVVRGDIFDRTYEPTANGRYRKSPNQIVGYWVTPDARTIQTLEGPVQANAGDYVMVGSIGEMWPVRPEQFARKYQTSGPADPRALDDIAPMTPDEVGPMPRQYRATPEDIMENPDRGTLASPARHAQSLATIAEEYGVEVARGARGGVNGKRTAANLARAARTNPALQAELRRRGLWAAVLTGGAAAASSAGEDPLDGVN